MKRTALAIIAIAIGLPAHASRETNTIRICSKLGTFAEFIMLSRQDDWSDIEEARPFGPISADTIEGLVKSAAYFPDMPAERDKINAALWFGEYHVKQCLGEMK